MASKEPGLPGVTKYAYEAFDHAVDNGESGWNASLWHSGQMEDPEWIRLDMPLSVRVTRYALCSRQNPNVSRTDFPNAFRFEGSNDGSTWTVLDTQNDQANSIAGEFARTEYSVRTDSSFSKYRLYVFDVGPDGNGRGEGEKKHAVLSEFELYGAIEETDRWTAPYWIVGAVVGIASFLVLAFFASLFLLR